MLTFHQPLLLSSSLKFYENKMYLLAEVTCNIPSDIQIDTCELVSRGDVKYWGLGPVAQRGLVAEPFRGFGGNTSLEKGYHMLMWFKV